MAYNKTNWQNSPSTETPINANNLNKIEEGIYANSLKADQVGDLTQLDTTNKSTLVNAINETLSTLEIIDISSEFTSSYNLQRVVALYIPKIKFVIVTFYVTGISGSGDALVLTSSTYKPNIEYYDAFYGVGGTTCYGWINSTGIRRLVGNSGLMSGTTMYTVA